MTAYYFDSSAIAKRYVNEQGSSWVQGIFDPTAGHVIIVCELTPVEVFSVFEAYKRNRGIKGPARLLTLRTTFLADYTHQYLSVSITSKVFVDARNLITRYKLWSLDAIQLACAIEFRAVSEMSIIFVSADNDLLKAAAGEGFPTENPLDHP